MMRKNGCPIVTIVTASVFFCALGRAQFFPRLGTKIISPCGKTRAENKQQKD